MVAFPPFRLDLAEERLWKGDSQVALRRKPFAILAFLVANPRRLVTHEELLHHVWTGQVVSESAVRTHVHELRQALGEGFIETVIGRGYRFTAELADDAREPSITVERRHLAGRDAKLATLRAAFAKASSGHRQLCFVSGDPGIGKTTLVDTFLDEIEANALVLRGACIEQYGAPEAYLAVLDLFGRLRAAPDRIAVLVRHAPAFALLLPQLLSDAQEADARKRARASGDAVMAREIVDALDALASTQPLIVVLEDLQWSDLATIDMIAQLGQRRERARILVIVTVRREAALSTAHPVSATMRMLVARSGAISISLSAIALAAIADILAQRFPGLAFPASFAAIVDRITGGTPLFVVALLDELVGRGMVVQRDGRWELAASLDEIAAHRPASVTQLIDIQLDRLIEHEQRTLEAASLVGGQFATGLVAAAMDASIEDVDDTCDSLVRRSLFLVRDGSEEWPDGTLHTRYAMTHSLVQQTSAERIPHARRLRQHRAIAERLEAAYRDRTQDVAHVIATHFDAGGVASRAADYYAIAGERAAKRFASADALRLYRSALTALAKLPPTRERDERELRILGGSETAIRHGENILSSFGMASAALRTTTRAEQDPLSLFERMVLLSRELHGPSKQLYTALTFLAARQTTLADNAAALLTCTEIETLLGVFPLDAAARAFVRGPTAINAFWRGDLAAARALLEELVADELVPGHTADRSRRHTVLVVYLASTTWLLGDPDRAIAIALRAREIAIETADPYATAASGNMVSELHLLRGERDAARRSATAVLALPVTEAWHPNAQIVLAWANHDVEPITHAAAAELVDKFRARCVALPMGTTWLAMLLIAALRVGGHDAMAREIADEAIAFAHAHGELVIEPRLVALRAELA